MADVVERKGVSISEPSGKRRTSAEDHGNEYVDPLISEPETEDQESEALPITDTHFKYTKIRTQFGKQTQFLEDRPRIHCGLRANTARYQPLFQQKSKVNKGEDTAVPLRDLNTNTSRAEFRTVSLLHTEGGWQKDVNVKKYESVEKARRKLQRDEAFADAVHNLSKEAEYLVKHNNTLGLCDPINKNPFVLKRDTKPSARVVGVYRCPTALKRPVSRISYAPGNAGRMAVAYCPYEFDPTFRDHTCEAFFWEVENPTRPEGMVRSAAQICDVRYHPSDVHSICGALFTGQVCTWDNRVGPNPQGISDFEVSHGDVCTNAVWCNAEVATHEFFSAGLDGGIIWWDERNLSERLKTVYAEAEIGKDKAKQPVPVTVLEYSVNDPEKFIVGSQFGHVLTFTKYIPPKKKSSRRSSDKGSDMPKSPSTLLAIQTDLLQQQESLIESHGILTEETRASFVDTSTLRNAEMQRVIMEQQQKVMENLDFLIKNARDVSSETKLEQNTLLDRQRSLLRVQMDMLDATGEEEQSLTFEDQKNIMDNQKSVMESYKILLESSQGLSLSRKSSRKSRRSIDIDEEEEDEEEQEKVEAEEEPEEQGDEDGEEEEDEEEGEEEEELELEDEEEEEEDEDDEEEDEEEEDFGRRSSTKAAEPQYFDPVAIYTAHRGPVTAIKRNPVYPEYFMSSGGYHLRFYSEAVHHSGIMWTSPSDSLYSYCQWLIGRPSCLVGSRMDGCLEFWDLLIQGSCSILTTKISEDALSFVCPSYNGRHIAAGTINGDIRVVEVCPFMSSFSSYEYDALGQLFARESRREQHIEDRQRERDGEPLSPRESVSRSDREPPASRPVSEAEKQLALHPMEKRLRKKPDPFKDEDVSVDKQFFDMLADEKKRQGVNAFPDKKEAAEQYSQMLIEGRKKQREEMLQSTRKDDDTALGSKQLMDINTKTVTNADESLFADDESSTMHTATEDDDEESTTRSATAQSSYQGTQLNDSEADFNE